MASYATDTKHSGYRLQPAVSREPWSVPERVREQFRKVYATINSWKPDGFYIGICSHGSGEGVSWVTSKLACAIAEQKESVVVLDANLARPTQRELFGITDAIPEIDLRSGSLNNQIVVASPVERSMKGTGSLSESVTSALTDLRSLTRIVLADCEPIADSAEVLHISSQLDGVLFIVQAEHQRKEVIGRTLQSLKRAQIPILGTVLTQRRHYIPTPVYRIL